MKALRLELYQETACYKKPFAFKVGETYPLPPYSTVKGWLHALLEAEQLIPMHLSVQGNYEAKMLDYQAHYFAKKPQSDEFPLILAGLPGVQEHEFVDMTQMPLYVHLLYNVHLLLHVVAEESVLKQLAERIVHADSHLSLGRWEDLVRVDKVELVDINPIDVPMESAYDAYVPMEMLPLKVRSIPYRLNWVYEIRNGTRRWRTVEVGYVPKGKTFNPGSKVWKDEKGSLVFLYPEIEFKG
jgi:CRISPR-associated protein Cas5t